jgi:hypothetical protein
METIVKKIRENIYEWRTTRKPEAPEAKKFTIRLGSTTFGTGLERRRSQRDGRVALAKQRTDYTAV